MIKFIATDMDGTLLNSQNEIHPSFYETFKKLKEKDIIFAIASGRQYYNLAKRFEELKDDVEVDSILMNIQETYDKLYEDDEVSFEYEGFKDENEKKKCKINF